MNKKRRRGFVMLPWEGRRDWIVELLSGRRWRSVILMLLGGVMLLLAWDVADSRARIRTTRAGMAEVRRAVAAFRSELGRCPRSTIELVHPPRSGARYLNELPDDGWDRPLYVRCPGRLDTDAAEVISAGPSGSFDVDDNVL